MNANRLDCTLFLTVIPAKAGIHAYMRSMPVAIFIALTPND